jgi:hypothetical protein
MLQFLSTPDSENSWVTYSFGEMMPLRSIVSAKAIDGFTFANAYARHNADSATTRRL